MKTKIVIAALLGALITNVVSAGNQSSGLSLNGDIGAKYVSDHYFRGQFRTDEALQANVNLTTKVGSVGLFGELFTNQSVDSTQADTNDITAGAVLSLTDNLDILAGVYNTENTGAGGDLEGFLKIKLDTLLSPEVAVFRNVDDELYTYEGSLSHEFDLDVLSLIVSGNLGNTELTEQTDSTYYGGRVAAVKSIGAVDLFADVAVTDNEDRDAETLWGAGLSVKF
jgi:hypothetical protein